MNHHALAIHAFSAVATSVRRTGATIPSSSCKRTRRTWVKLAATCIVVVGVKGAPVDAADQRRALLVGVSQYPNLAAQNELKGPENDVAAMRELLEKKFSLPSDAIRTLSDSRGEADPTMFPTRKNIEREFNHLANVSESGDEVVIYMSGHGSQQPERVGGKPEIDALDEIFLPRDVKQWREDTNGGQVPNAIVDDEIARWLQAIESKGARLWVIFDCCHSGDMTRGLNEKDRFVAFDEAEGLAVSASALEATRQLAREREMKHESKSGDDIHADLIDLDQQQHMAVFFACQSHEKAIERAFPTEIQGKKVGLLTYAIDSALSKAKGKLSYRDLGKQIHNEYISAGRVSSPTPLVEGGDMDRAVMGTETLTPAQITATYVEAKKALSIDAGRVHGITPGTVLVVYPPPGQVEEGKLTKKELGYAEVIDVDIARATISPCKYKDLPKVAHKTFAGGRCEVAEIDYGDLRIPVYVDGEDSDNLSLPVADRELLKSILRGLDKEANSLVSQAASKESARWLVRLKNNEVTIDSSQQAIDRRSGNTATLAKATRSVFGPFAINKELPNVLRTSLTRIARAENLLKLAAQTGSVSYSPDKSPAVQFKPEVKLERNGETLNADGVPEVHPGDRISIRVENTGQGPIDLTILYVNSELGIAALYPRNNDANRIGPKQKCGWIKGRIENGPFGRGHLICLAVHTEGPPVDFTSLAQPTIGKDRSQGAPLESLLANAIYGIGDKRRAPVTEVQNYNFELLPINVVRVTE